MWTVTITVYKSKVQDARRKMMRRDRPATLSAQLEIIPLSRDR